MSPPIPVMCGSTTFSTAAAEIARGERGEDEEHGQDLLRHGQHRPPLGCRSGIVNWSQDSHAAREAPTAAASIIPSPAPGAVRSVAPNAPA